MNIKAKLLFNNIAQWVIIGGFLFPLFGGIKGGFSQDIHFSQFYQTPLLINPALTGAFNGEQRAIVNYKDQWRSIDAPYQTYAFGVDMAMFKKKWENSYLGAGLFVFHDKAGEAAMKQTQVNLSLSSITALSENHTISIGFQGGFAQRGVDAANQKWDTQYCPTCTDGHDPAAPSYEASNFNTFGFADFSAGAVWSFGTDEANMISNDGFRANAGVAYHHINEPKQEFYNEEKLNPKIVAHGGLYVGMKNSNTAILPSIIYFQQGGAREINAGMMIRYTVKEESRYTGIFKETALQIGGYYRVGDAVIPAIVFEYGHWAVGVNYDFNISKLRAASNTRGGIEISLRYVNPNPFKYGKGTGSNVKFL
ncbi:MAG: hypothetical protein COA57_02360 [Flavobacteriales bacterium]|nr:MAG: hypothetical protein COA57_02360 [Flavobacteriales bacterium]